MPHAQRHFRELERIAHQLAGQLRKRLADPEFVPRFFTFRFGEVVFYKVLAAQRNLRKDACHVACVVGGGGVLFGHDAKLGRSPRQRKWDDGLQRTCAL